MTGTMPTPGGRRRVRRSGSSAPVDVVEREDAEAEVVSVTPRAASVVPRAPRRRRVLRTVLAALLAAAAIAAVVVSFTGLPEGEAETAKLITAKVERGDARTEVGGSGTVAPASTLELSFDASASSSTPSGGGSGASGSASVVRRVYVKRGQRVRAGQVLARLDRTSAQLQLKAAQNTYDAAVASRDDPATTTQDGETTQLQSDEALDLAVAEAAVTLGEARTALAATTLTAPRAAVVDSVAVVVGSVPPSDTAAITLRSAGMQVSIDVAEDDISDVAVGQRAEVRLVALDASVTGKVVSVDAAEDTSSTTSSTPSGVGATSSSGAVTFPVAIRLERLPKGIRAGMSAEVVVVTAEKTDVLVVPITAISGSGANATARVPGAGGGIDRTPVEVGLVTSSTAEVVSGLAEGDEVVTGVVAPADEDEEAQSGSSPAGLGGGGGFGGGGVGGPPGGAGGPPPGGFSGGGPPTGGGAGRG